MWSIKAILRLLKAVDVVVVVVVNIVVVALFVVIHQIYLFVVNVNMRLMEAAIEFVWWGGGGVRQT